MTDETPALPPPSSPSKPESTGLLVACATIILLAAFGAGGYLLWQELQRVASAPPQSPPEVTQALGELRTQLDRQRSDSAEQLKSLQDELATLKEQQAAHTPPDMDATLAPMQERLDAIAAQLQQAPAALAVAEAPVAEPVATPIVIASNPLREYLALRRAVEAGGPYAAELAALIPQLPDSEQASIATLQTYAEHGLGVEDEEAEPTASELKPWMQSVNERFAGLISIKPHANRQAPPQARAAALAALDAMETSLMEQP